MDVFEVKRQVLGRPVRVSVLPCGDDFAVTIRGGDAPHVGSVTVARNGEIVSKWVGQGHRDDVVGDGFATGLSQRAGGVVCAVCGIHYDSVTEEQLAEIVAAREELLQVVLERKG